MSKPKWDSTTLKTVQAIWAMTIGSAVLLAAIFFVLPHLGDDGAFTRDDIYVVAGFSILGAIIAFPTAVMQGIGGVVNAVRAWRGKNGGEA